MKKFLTFSLLALIAVFLLTGCRSSKSFTFVVETGDNIKIELDTSDGYDISSTLPFEISKDGSIYSQGDFITLEGYQMYINLVKEDPNSTILDSGTQNGVEYTFYTYNNSEFNYIIKVKNSNTGLLLGNITSKESAEECFNLLTFTKE